MERNELNELWDSWQMIKHLLREFRYNESICEPVAIVDKYINKQYPRNPKARYSDIKFRKYDYQITKAYCPTCLKQLSNFPKHCSNCGQALKYGSPDFIECDEDLEAKLKFKTWMQKHLEAPLVREYASED